MHSGLNWGVMHKFLTLCIVFIKVISLIYETSMKLHDCEAIEIESVEEVSIGLESVKKALRKCQETNKRFP